MVGGWSSINLVVVLNGNSIGCRSSRECFIEVALAVAPMCKRMNYQSFWDQVQFRFQVIPPSLDPGVVMTSVFQCARICGSMQEKGGMLLM